MKNKIENEILKEIKECMCKAKLSQHYKTTLSNAEEELDFLNLGKIKIEGKTDDMEVLIRLRIIKLKETITYCKKKLGVGE